MVGRQAAERADDGPELALAAVAGKHAEEIRGDRIEPELCRDRGEAPCGRFGAVTSGLVDQLRKVVRIGQRLLERVEAVADRVDLSLVTGEVEQSGCITPC